MALTHIFTLIFKLKVLKISLETEAHAPLRLLPRPLSYQHNIRFVGAPNGTIYLMIRVTVKYFTFVSLADPHVAPFIFVFIIVSLICTVIVLLFVYHVTSFWSNK